MRDLNGAVRQILEVLLESKTLNYNRTDIEKAIIQCRGVDPRTVRVWFNVLWKFNYIVQPEQGLYRINYDKASSLEVKLPVEVDPKQRRLI